MRAGAMTVLSAVLLALAARWYGTSAPARAAASGLPFYDGPDFTPRWQPVSHRVGAFRLVGQRGTQVTEADLDGRIHVAAFVFTRCTTLCPTLMLRLRDVAERTRAFSEMRIVAYSVTPDADTPAVLAAFGRGLGVDPARFWLLTGDARQVRALIRESYFADDRRLGPDAGLLHTEKLLLVDRARRLRGIYDGTQRFEIERLLQDLDSLRAGDGG